jgi:hypothetical protein
MEPSVDSQILLFLDISIFPINFCHEEGIIILGFLPHTPHHLQPLHVSFFRLLKSFTTRPVIISWCQIQDEGE